ncbi:MAG: PQQ-dependent sugar dehydrogenase, partial [Ignavibacterium sp.]|nr:PQQ-dependent sugar dehydrogenase [Ignavibacterium sp.]
LNTVTFSQFALEDAFPNFTFQNAVDLQHANDLSDRLFVVDQSGLIKVFQNDASTNSAKNFLDITDRVISGGEQGLLGLAFHPDYENNGYFYVYYTTPNPLRTILSRFQISTMNPDSADKDSELILLTYNQPQTNHNGGCLAFGPDGYLYIASGDGGSSNNGQEITNLLGKIIRIDVDNPQLPLNYGIPADNPFVDSTNINICKEIYAWGLRNPWRFSFDTATDQLWAGDVGQNDWEEIDIIENGKNYGWPCYEGNHPLYPSGCNDFYEFPIWEYSHSVGFSIIGGYVYRGPNLPELYGKYIYADYVAAKVWNLEYDGLNPATSTLLLTAPGSITSFGVDQNQELYVLSANGKIYRFTPTAAIIAPSYLRLQSTIPGETNLFWKDNSTNETGFIIERQTNPSETFIVIDSVSTDVTSFSDVVTDTAFYTYRVRAYDALNQSGYSNEASINIRVVPVELTLFNGKYEDGEISLNWITATETNNFGFQVEKRSDNSAYESIGFVKGSGTSTNRVTYNFVDRNIKSNRYYYRLKQIDFNGTFKYSNEVQIDIKGFNNFQLYQNYPNPFNPTTKISWQSPENGWQTLKVYDILGNEVATLVNEEKPAGIYEVEFNATSGTKNPASGIYFYQLRVGEFIQTKKMTLIK